MIKNYIFCHLYLMRRSLHLLRDDVTEKENLIMRNIKFIFCILLAAVCAAAPAQENNDLKIAVFGSSTVWGNGLLGERSIAGVIDEYLRNSLSQSVYPENMKFSATFSSSLSSCLILHSSIKLLSSNYHMLFWTFLCLQLEFPFPKDS